MKKRRIVFTLILALAMIVSSACSGSPSETDNQAQDPLRAHEGTTLNVLVKTGYESAAITEFEKEFEDATGIQLEIEVVDEPTLRKKFILDSTSQTGAYDVVATQFWYMPEYLKLGALEPLDAYIANKKSPWLAIEDMPEGVKKTYKGEDGKLYALPVSASGGVLIYRTDLFKKYSIPVPKTTEDVLAAARTLKEKLPEGVVPFVGRGNSSSESFGSSVGWAWAYDAAVLENGKVTVNSDKMRQAMNDWVTLMKEYGPKDASAMGWDTMSEMFRQGKAAMNFDMSGFPSVYANPEMSKVADKVGVATITGPGGNPAQWLYGEGLAISKYSDNKEAAWLFLQWRTSLEVAKKEVEKGLRFDFPLDSIYSTEIYKEKTKDLPFTKQIPDIMASIDSTYWPNVKQFDKAGQAFQEQISLAIAGNQDVKAALKKAHSQIKSIVK